MVDVVPSFYAFVALKLVKGVGDDELRRLPRDTAPVFEELQTSAGLREVSSLIGFKIDEIPWKWFDDQLRAIDSNNVIVVTHHDDDYPRHLRDIDESPSDARCVRRVS